MPFNGSGTFTPEIDWTTEAASPPIEISKLDTQDEDMADGFTNCLTRDGQSPPTANIPMGGFRLTGLGAATALTDGVSATVVIDQELHYYVDSGSANTYAITPAPAIAAYEEGQRFVVRIANGNSGASTLNVNGLGAIAIQHPDGSALQSGALATGGIFEFTYDANTTPDRWVLTSPAAEIADGMLSSNVALLNASWTLTHNTNPSITITDADNSVSVLLQATGSGEGTFGTLSAHPLGFYTGGALAMQITSAGNFDFIDGTALFGATLTVSTGGIVVSAGGVNVTGDVTTPNTSAAEIGFKGSPINTQNGNYTLVLTDAGKTIYKASGGAGETITIPANGAVAFPVGTQIWVDNDGGGDLSIAITTDELENAAGATGTRTIADNATVELRKLTATKWRIIGATT